MKCTLISKENKELLNCWMTALTQAGIAASDTADSCLKSSHLTRTRHAHHVTAVALAKLQHDVFLKMVIEGSLDDADKEAWRRDMAANS